MKKILITAFGAFAGNFENYSTRALLRVKLPENAHREFIPVGFEESPRCVLSHLEEDDYDAVILVGEAADRSHVTIEKIAINWKEATICDNYGLMPRGERIEENAPDGLFPNVDVRDMVDTLRSRGIDVVTSFSAGTFVCNTLYWSILRACPEKKVIFMHVPRRNEENSVRAISAAIEYLSE